MRRKAEHETPVCNLQLRSYSVRNLEAFADFALRAAYYLNLPAKGPVPLPRITERWTVPRANFIFKKSQENFERITLRRLIQIQDGHPQSVAIWLGFLQKYSYYGIGMKANVFEHGPLSVAENMDKDAQRIERVLGMDLAAIEGTTDKEKAVLKKLKLRGDKLATTVFEESFKAAFGADAAMAGAQSVKGANEGVQGWNLKDATEDSDEASGASPGGPWERATRTLRARSQTSILLPAKYQNLPRLTSDAERTRLQEEGRCLRCRELGHTRDDTACPLYHISPPTGTSQKIPYTIPEEYRKLGKLKNSQRTALRKEGKCVSCRQPGHTANDEACPLYQFRGPRKAKVKRKSTSRHKPRQSSREIPSSAEKADEVEESRSEGEKRKA